MESNMNHFLKFSTLTLLFAGLLLSGCVDEPDLPTSLNNSDDFGANDTSFVRVAPDWSNGQGYDWENPGEIHIARDGYMYVADEKDGGRVTRMKLDGSIVDRSLFQDVIDTTGRAPVGLGQCSKLNLYMVDGSDNIYARNTAVEHFGIEEIVVSFEMIDLRTGDRYTIDNSRPVYEQLLDLVMDGVDSLGTDYNSVVTTSDPDTLARYEREYVFLADTTGDHPSQFTDVDGGPAGEEIIYVADQGNDRVVRYQIATSRVLFLNDGSVAYAYAGLYIDDTVEFGSGQVSTNNPTSIVTTGSGTSTRLYFTQVDGNFLFQRLRPAGDSWQFDVAASGDGPPLIELDYFGAPVGVAVGESDEYGLGLIYVADSLQNRVTAFYSGGATFRHVAAETELVDLEPGEYIVDALDALGIDWYPDLNQDLIGYYSGETVDVEVAAGQTIAEAVAAAGYEFDSLLNPDLNPDATVVEATVISVRIPIATTVEVSLPTLDKPRGVATRDGVVYISDSGHNRIVRYSRSDSDSYIPNDPNY